MKDIMVFDIQRFSLHDGPGIRTTIFLKGCPLHCLWCHNPESQSIDPQLGFLSRNCILCGQCETICNRKVHHVTPDGHKIDFNRCKVCGECVEACYNRALKIFGKRYSVEELIRIALQDTIFYSGSGGGITISGGEPMLQFDALEDLLKAAKEHGLHVCLDTSGASSAEKYLRIMPFVDIFLYDYKVTGKEAYRTYTGADEDVILGNLDMLCREGAKIILRCPIIPSVNDTEEHYLKIAELSNRYNSIIEVNPMPYHDMAKGKVDQIGMEYKLHKLKTIDEEQKGCIFRKLQSAGCVKAAES